MPGSGWENTCASAALTLTWYWACRAAGLWLPPKWRAGWKRPLDALIVRKIGHPLHREFAVGALAEPDIVVFDEESSREVPVPRSQLDRVVAEETARLREYCLLFHPAGAPALDGKAVLLVDDGLATGATTEAAVLSARRQRARRVIVAAPVASPNAVERLRRAADDVVALVVDPGFCSGRPILRRVLPDR